MKHLTMFKSYFGLLMDWLATPIVWLFWPIRKRWLGCNIANIISLARLPLMVWIMTKLVDADPQQTIRLIFCVGAVQILDGLDGPVARGLGTDGPRGGAIDDGIDKINTLMFVGVLIWQLADDGASKAALGLSCALLAFVVLLQAATIHVNNQRQHLTKELGKSFSSRLPAQVNFIASMLIIATCWLIPDADVAVWVLLLGSDLMLLLSGWTLEDYANDLQQLQFEKFYP